MDDEEPSEDEDIAIAKATQASLDSAKAKMLADDLKSFQQEIGVKHEVPADFDSDVLMLSDEQDDKEEEGEEDIVMADASDEDDES